MFLIFFGDYSLKTFVYKGMAMVNIFRKNRIKPFLLHLLLGLVLSVKAHRAYIRRQVYS